MIRASVRWLLLIAAWAWGAGALAQQADLIARGEYLARVGGCAGCHTAPKGGAPFAGGRGVPSPLGAIFSTNITPDPQHGIGDYSLDDFARALREGTARGGKQLYPAMPYTAYAKLGDDDVRALYAYLRDGVAPMTSDPPRNDLPFPFNQRWMLRAWKLLFMPRGAYVTRDDKQAEWNRGAYLVQSLGHCGTCHTPRGIAYQERGYDERSKLFLTGAVNDHWFASNLTGDPGSGLGRVDADALASFLKTGHGGGAMAYGTMAQEVEESLQHLSDDDVRAVTNYLKSLPAQRGSGTYSPTEKIIRTPAQGNRTGDVESTGAATYRTFCAQCHHVDGKGVPNTFPRLAGSPSVLAEDPSSLIRLIVEGGRSAATAHGPPVQSMPAFAGTLSDVEMAQVLAHVRQAWGNDARPVTTSDVARIRKALRK